MSDAPAVGDEGTTNDVVDTEIDWPEFYTDPDTSTTHAWDDVLPPDEDAYDSDDGGGYTYRDLVHDRAGAAHMDIGEYLNHLRWRAHPLHDEPDGIAPSWVDNGSGYGR